MKKKPTQRKVNLFFAVVRKLGTHNWTVNQIILPFSCPTHKLCPPRLYHLTKMLIWHEKHFWGSYYRINIIKILISLFFFIEK